MGGSFNSNFENYLIVQRVAEKTRKAYLQSVQGLEAFHEQPADKLSNTQIQDYLIYCIQEKELAWSSCNVLFCGLKKFYSGYLARDESKFSIPPRPRSRQLPMLLSHQEVKSILLATGNLKHKSLLALVYGSGLRVSEAVSLEPLQIESKRMMVRVEQSKAAKIAIQFYPKPLLSCYVNTGVIIDPGNGSFSVKTKMFRCQLVPLKRFSIMPKKKRSN